MLPHFDIVPDINGKSKIYFMENMPPRLKYSIIQLGLNYIDQYKYDPLNGMIEDMTNLYNYINQNLKIYIIDDKLFKCKCGTWIYAHAQEEERDGL